jgi:hypothetical protein
VLTVYLEVPYIKDFGSYRYIETEVHSGFLLKAVGIIQKGDDLMGFYLSLGNSEHILREGATVRPT